MLRRGSASFHAPTRAVFPSEERATRTPWFPVSEAPHEPLPTSFDPCWAQTPPERVNTQAAPMPPSSLKPPSIRVFAVRRQRHGVPLGVQPDGVGAPEERALRAPDPAAAREHPHRSIPAAAPASADGSRVAIRRQGDRPAEDGVVRTDPRACERRPLLRPDASAARPDPGGEPEPADQRGVSVSRERDRGALVGRRPAGRRASAPAASTCRRCA